MVTKSTPVGGASQGDILEERTKRDKYLELLLVALVYAVVIGVLRVGTFETPPTWDAAMTVWPAAIEMSESGPAAVLQMPTYGDGGPNTHTLSLVTILTSVTIALFGGSAAILLGHVVNVVILCLIGVALYALVRPYYKGWGAGVVGLAGITFPVMVGQSAYLYTDLPASMLAFLAMVVAMHRHPVFGGVLAALAVSVKPLAVVVVPAVWLINRRRGMPRSRSIATAFLGLIGLVPALLVSSGSMGNSTVVDRIKASIARSVEFLRNAPELMVLPVLAIGLWLVSLWVIRRGKARDNTWAVATAVLVLFFGMFFATNGILTPGYFALPRYLVLIVPAVFGSAAIVMAGHKRRAIGLMIAVTIFSLATSRGPLALGSDSRMQPVAERSLAFIELFRMHADGLDQLAELSESMPIYYNHHSHYGVQYPAMNHLDREISEGVSPSVESVWDDTLESLPNQFAMMLEHPWLGGQVLWRIHDAAVDDPEYSVDRWEIEGRVPDGVFLAVVTRDS